MAKPKDAIQKILDNHEKRLIRLEANLSPSFKPSKSNPKSYKGLSGGILFLVERKFFNQPRSLREVKDELRRESYHYSDAPLAKTLSVYFCKNKKLLTRIREDRGWKYVLRK